MASSSSPCFEKIFYLHLCCLHGNLIDVYHFQNDQTNAQLFMTSFVFQDAERTHFHWKSFAKNERKWEQQNNSQGCDVSYPSIEISFNLVLLNAHVVHAWICTYRSLSIDIITAGKCDSESTFQIVNNYVSFRIIFPLIRQPSNRNGTRFFVQLKLWDGVQNQ